MSASPPLERQIAVLALNHPARFSPGYRGPLFEAIMLQALLLLLSGMLLDGGTMTRVCGIAAVAFWGGVIVLIWRRPRLPTPNDIKWVRLGYLPVVAIAFFLVHVIWILRGVE